MTGCDYWPIHERPDYHWPGAARLAVYPGSYRYFAFGEGLRREARRHPGRAGCAELFVAQYGNRVGAWRCLELF